MHDINEVHPVSAVGLSVCDNFAAAIMVQVDIATGEPVDLFEIDADDLVIARVVELTFTREGPSGEFAEVADPETGDTVTQELLGDVTETAMGLPAGEYRVVGANGHVVDITVPPFEGAGVVI
ncbi:hypothetical protein [Alteraurantiacibacter palmitatis]|uniref:Uncharacterized protein n=1 Tax=Alteraurantiacibacter palmitatis TaxID=2054628 RepID=A0ABV7E4H5_9SPHN